ncbi:MAG: DUF2800 domain-containing protein [Candidatus Liberibacter asiaticus]|uniref:DUF2800 domain-containing protein n=2 Tax=Liberibacter asiaticus TaxID=34021 RepID=UPI001F34CDEB|nr:DUF2800 domain-containing protein [Candidatus Liberibacter asiaticus]MCU7488354.1 DUF2800 domain-containing protein [Candidatus Liberibacter asiaticus]WCM57384.1 DUF2800 domain-containing protein [Candidatus Liberibacter asiaticus]WCM58410.1 DUF2800 domain-containing protein [Candidatus Liberibacter asiaticus]WLD01362.1 DUF2800 domain-containing protein [Candidatus Liberibacter asiaticus]
MATIRKDGQSFGVDENACRFCRAKPRCGALAVKALSTFSEHMQILSNRQLSQVMNVLPLIETWMKGVKEEALNVLSSGEDLPNYELKEGRKGSRTYNNDNQVEQLLMRELGDEAYNRTLLSPTETEQLVKRKKVSETTWEQLQKFITRKDGKQVIVPCDLPVNHLKANISEFSVLKD